MHVDVQVVLVNVPAMQKREQTPHPEDRIIS